MIKMVFEKQPHDCYSTREYADSGELARILWVCPVCGPWVEWRRGRGMKHLQPPGRINHSGMSLRGWGE
jgi:hypothetical protein